MVVVLAVGLLLSTFVLSPVSAHVGENVGHLWNAHLKPKVEALVDEAIRRDSVKVVTLTGGPVTIDTPGETVPISLSPSSDAAFTQKAGQVVAMTMDFTVVGNDNSVFCDVHASADLTKASTPQESTVAHIQTHFQRGDEWPHMWEVGSDATRTVPGPSTDTARTVIAAAFMDVAEPNSIDGCYGGGSNVPAPDQVMQVSVRVSIIRY